MEQGVFADKRCRDGVPNPNPWAAGLSGAGRCVVGKRAKPLLCLRLPLRARRPPGIRFSKEPWSLRWKRLGTTERVLRGAQHGLGCLYETEWGGFGLRHRERPRDDGGRHWGDVASSPGTLEPLEAGRGKKDPPLGFWREGGPVTPRSRTSAPGPGGNSFCFKPPSLWSFVMATPGKKSTGH